jgi:mannose-6-phosphate isomerase-like protein (cupin superfamily)
MKRHPALVPLSHDHHHALVAARRVRRGADSADGEAAEAFLAFFARDSVRHFREEEELLFPAAAGNEEARDPILRALGDHQRLHALAARLRASLAAEKPDTAVMRELGETLEAHVRHEERVLFPLLERVVDEETLAALPLGGPAAAAGAGGPVWGAESEDLNATLLVWPPGAGPPEHVNDERDVLVVVLEGSAAVAVDGEERELGPGEPLIVPKGATRRIAAGPVGVRYLAAHLRRPPLQIRPAGRAQ